MKFYLDSANIEEIKVASDLPYFSGVTTNPILLSKSGVVNREKFYESILTLIPKKELFVQVFSRDAEGVYKEALSLSSLARDRIIIKIPATDELLKTANRLTLKGIRVCLTAVSSIRQIAISGTLNIEYCAVYLNRMLKTGKEIYKQISDSSKMITENLFNTRILIASLPDESLIEPILMYKNLDYTLPFKPFMNLLKTRDSEEWIRGFYEVSNKNSVKR